MVGDRGKATYGNGISRVGNGGTVRVGSTVVIGSLRVG